MFENFKLVINTSLMIVTQIRLPWRIVQAGGAVLLKNQPEPTTFKTRIGLQVRGFYCV
jgi:hypothetical protein